MKRVMFAVALAVSFVGVSAAAQQPGKKPPPPAPPAAADVINSVEGNPEVEAETRGKYPGLQRDEVLPLGQIQHAWDNADTKAGVYVVDYAADKVMRVRVREFIPSTIVFPSWETFSSEPLLGDSFAFEAGWAAPGKLALRAKQVGTDTAVTLFGDSGNVYAFYVRSEGANSINVPDVLVYVRAPLPIAMIGRVVKDANAQADGAKAGGEALKPVGNVKQAKSASERQVTGEFSPDFVKGMAFDPAKLRFDFSMAGDRSIAPARVFTDGIFTFFDFGDRWDSSDLPAVYRVVDGVDTPVNTRIKGTMLIAEASGAFTLRNGQRTVCVRPEGFEPEGAYQPPASAGASSVPPELHDHGA
jgi:ComB9 competence protein